ncbi:CPBP family intramembrane glutamic endopeptidase [Sphingomonas oligophenolica]|uniref:CPBP family intramembrane metalloprotease n=1 Tax=Sphingomonas oligophenolica TaxID=301154 RepID=A0A502CK01_9SPHN|nr:CPBP family intramembrane glutamic endopeptidase [Sphingomonas oligophenolica]TPG12031.1 CPBP family intramembrane metalloprotease [Sphingomonas oligophenolica]
MIPGVVLPLVLLAGALASYWAFLRGDFQSWPVVARWLCAGTRVRFFALWCVRALVLFGLVGVAGLVLAGHAGAIWTLPPDLAPARAIVFAWIGDGRDFPVGWMILALFGGGAIGGLVDRLRRGRKPWMFGDITRVMPRHRGELVWGAAMAIVAGTAEEIFFRLLVPLLVTLVTGEPLVGFAVAIALFAGAHRYQGWQGVTATAFVGLLLSVLYLMTGALWVAMLVHVVIDLNGLVLRPIMAGAGGVSSSAATRF